MPSHAMTPHTALPETITIHTDQGPLRLPIGSTVEQALLQLMPAAPLTPTALATAVNGEFVPRSQRATHTLQHGDQLLCFSAITGG